MALPRIDLTHFAHRNKNNIRLDFAYDETLIRVCKSLSCRWSATHKCWYIENTKSNFDAIFRAFKNIALLNITALKNKDSAKQHSPKNQRKANSSKKKFNELNPLQKKRIQEFTEFLKGRRYSKSTVDVYGSMMVDFLWFTREKQLSALSHKDVELYNQQVILPRNYSISYQRQFVSAVKLFAGYAELTSLEVDKLIRPKKEKKLPVVLSKEEVFNLIRVTRNLKHRAMLTAIYSCGLRIGELLNLKLSDMDIDRRQVRIEQAKGNKDRMVVLSEAFIPMLINYVETYRPDCYFIEGKKGRKYSPESVRAVLQRSCKAAGIIKHVTPHTLRHTYATHLLENGTDIRYIQELLGHQSPDTTMIYTHVTKKDLLNINSPLDGIVRELGTGDKPYKNMLLSRNMQKL